MQDKKTHQFTNSLVNSASPYLLQHAHNPVNWYSWGEEALTKAKVENKLILISIGYSACHWCHVMEKESFENEHLANIMNQNFVCIKVDREERPDIDQIYMNAVQLMSGQGGWPLNCFALPDGRPIYGGTYFPPSNWERVLKTVADLYQNDKEKVLDYAQKLTNGIKMSDTVKINFSEKIDKKILLEAVEDWKQMTDDDWGGPNRAPKFPLPNNYLFLLRQAIFENDKALLEHVFLTLDKMAYGAIYDQIGGGFARYSVDIYWKIPHFEKMLYDNAQLLSLYSKAFTHSKNNLYKEIVFQTIDFIEREMSESFGAWYSALDADSEGEEGKFYVWKREELLTIFESIGRKDLFDFVSKYYNINEFGYWEEENYVLIRNQSDEDFCNQFKYKKEDLIANKKEVQEILLKERTKRIRPGLDNKVLTSWNALCAEGYIDSFLAFGEQKHLDRAEKNLNYLFENNIMKDGGIYHLYKNEKNAIIGFLEDYAFTISACLKMYQAKFDKKWLDKAVVLKDYAMSHFYDDTTGMFFFTSSKAETLIARKFEISDNVIPASNSVMANNLFEISKFTDDFSAEKLAIGMLKSVLKPLKDYASGYSNWAILFQKLEYPFKEIIATGEKSEEMILEIQKSQIFNAVFAATKNQENLPLFKNRCVEGKNLIYVCENKSCQFPFENLEDFFRNI
jgi:uncharacterized protein